MSDGLSACQRPAARMTGLFAAASASSSVLAELDVADGEAPVEGGDRVGSEQSARRHVRARAHVCPDAGRRAHPRRREQHRDPARLEQWTEDEQKAGRGLGVELGLVVGERDSVLREERLEVGQLLVEVALRVTVAHERESLGATAEQRHGQRQRRVVGRVQPQLEREGVGAGPLVEVQAELPAHLPHLFEARVDPAGEPLLERGVERPCRQLRVGRRQRRAGRRRARAPARRRAGPRPRRASCARSGRRAADRARRGCRRPWARGRRARRARSGSARRSSRPRTRTRCCRRARAAGARGRRRRSAGPGRRPRAPPGRCLRARGPPGPPGRARAAPRRSGGAPGSAGRRRGSRSRRPFSARRRSRRRSRSAR